MSLGKKYELRVKQSAVICGVLVAEVNGIHRSRAVCRVAALMFPSLIVGTMKSSSNDHAPHESFKVQSIKNAKLFVGVMSETLPFVTLYSFFKEQAARMTRKRHPLNISIISGNV